MTADSCQDLRTLTVAEVSKILHLSPYTLRDMTKQKKIKAFKPIKSQWRILESDLRSFIKSRQNKN